LTPSKNRPAAQASRSVQPIRFWDATIGKKAVMAVTGIIWFGYLIAHLLGNLQIYSPNRDQINAYAAFLHSPGNAGLLWIARAVLIAAIVLHIVASIQLTALKRAARPAGYVKKKHIPNSYAARTMMWSGPIIAAFILFHIAHFTLGAVPGLPLEHITETAPDVRANVIDGFRRPLVSGIYVLAMGLLCMHLYHGLFSIFQTLGVNHPRYTRGIRVFAAIAAGLICLGNISIPISVMLGLVD
jgi:succinate dehydrogenase / fumarate reductase cytochrome b subunit